ncbi:MAG: carbohydrate ABC transporter permease [Devosia sp.]
MTDLVRPLELASSPVAVWGRKPIKWGDVTLYLLFCLFTFIWMLPALWSLITSFRHEADIQRQLITLMPNSLTLESYARILGDGQVAQWFVNSIAVSGIRTIVQIALCSLAAFAFARIPFRGKRPLYLLVLVGLMVPFEAVLIPVYLLFASAHLHNTWWALIAPDIASPLALFLLTQFFQEIPPELDEAAYIDGASRFTVYFQIILPLAKPILATLAIFTFLGTWNEYLWPLVSATNRDSLTLTIGLRKLAETFGHQERNLGLKMAGAWVGGIPILIFYFIFQRRIVDGIRLTSGFK